MPKTWQHLYQIPIGTRFRPNFDELVHPVKRLPYRKQGEDLYVDLTDGEELTEHQMLNWWSWIGGPLGRGFEEIES